MLRNSKLVLVVFVVISMMGLGQAAFAAADAQTNVVASNPLSNSLTEKEIEGILFTREEEKVARDVYLTLGDIWGRSIFDNIAASEQNHMDAMLDLLDQYGLSDPAAGNDVGSFTNPELQEMYDNLVERGAQSLTDALEVGIYIEEVDITDLQTLMAESDNGDLDRVYGNLLSGSENHLRSFVSNWERQTGEIYLSTHLSDADFAAIINNGSRTP